MLVKLVEELLYMEELIIINQHILLLHILIDLVTELMYTLFIIELFLLEKQLEYKVLMIHITFMVIKHLC